MESLFNYAKTLLYALFIYLGIKTGVVKILFILMLFDSVLGILKSWRLGVKFSFKVLAWGIVTKLSILIIPMIVALMGKALEFDFSNFIIIIVDIIIVHEGISCITNIYSIRIKRQIENTDYISMMLGVIKNIFSGLIKRLLSVLESAKNNDIKT